MEGKDIFFIILGIIFIIVLLIIVLFSSIILITIICNWHFHCRSISNLLTVNSCTAFLIFALTFSLQIPYLFRSNETENNSTYTLFCRIRALLCLFASVAKVCSYLIQAISRYFITVLYKRRNLVTFRINGIMIILSWIISIIISSGMLISPVSFQYESESRFCTITSKVFHTSFPLMIIAFIIPVNIIVTLYGLVLWHTTRASRIHPNNIITGNIKRNIKVFKNILRLITVLVIGGTPFLLCIIINKITHIPWPLYSISLLFIALSAAVESITIFFNNKEVQTIFCAKIGFRKTGQIRSSMLASIPNKTQTTTTKI